MESGDYLTNNQEAKYRTYPESYNKKVPYFDGFMNRYSESHWKHKRNQIIRFTLYIEEKRKKKLLDIDVYDVLSFFKMIDKEAIVRSTKNKWRHIVNAYYKYAKEIIEKMEKKPFINPVPSINLFDFTEKTLDIEALEKEEDLLTYPIAEKMLKYLFITRPKYFVLISLILYSGARIMEVCRIELKNIDYQERFFYTKVKSKKYLNRWGIYFYPEFFVPFLRSWIEKQKLEYPRGKYLFQSINGHISTNTVRKHLRNAGAELNIKCRLNPHAFRNLINEERFDTYMEEKFRFLLLNQTPPNVNVKSYIKKYKLRKELLKKYDEFFPFPELKLNFSI